MVALLVAVLFLPGMTLQAPAQGTSPNVQLTGWFTVIWGDGMPGSGEAPLAVYLLTSEDGQTYRLELDEALLEDAGGVLALNRQRLSVEASPAPLSPDPGLPTVLRVISLTPPSYPLNAASPVVSTAVSGSQPWVSILCKFSDIPDEPKSLTYFQDMYRSAYPGLDHYWREVSYNTISLSGSTARGWYTLPQPRASYFLQNGSLNLSLAASDCTAAADADVYYPDYQGINLMFNDILDDWAWGGAQCIPLDGVFRCWRMTWEPPWGYSNITTIAHEMGHGYRLPHSSGAYGKVYDNVWDVMSAAWSYCSRSNHPTYGCLGQHTISYHKDILGWIPAGKKYTVSYASGVLEQAVLPAGQSFLMVQIPISGSSTYFYTVEVRNQSGYDVKLPGQAVIIHQVDTTRYRPAYVVDIDNNGNTGDAGAMWTVGETFEDATNQISVTVLAASGNSYQVRINNGSQTTTLWLDPLAQIIDIYDIYLPLILR